MEPIKNMCLTSREAHQDGLLGEIVLMAVWVLLSMWFFNIPFSNANLGMLSVAVAGYAGCKMVISPESMADYFWPKIWSMAAVAAIGGLLIYQSYARLP